MLSDLVAGCLHCFSSFSFTGDSSTRLYLHRLMNELQPTSLITTLCGASEKCPYSRSAAIPEVSIYVSQLDGTLLWA